jgi:hypothetical protein
MSSDRVVAFAGTLAEFYDRYLVPLRSGSREVTASTPRWNACSAMWRTGYGRVRELAEQGFRPQARVKCSKGTGCAAKACARTDRATANFKTGS